MAQRVTLAVPGPNGQDLNLGTTASPLVTTAGSSASPDIVGGEYSTTPPTLVNGGTDSLQLGLRGAVRVQIMSANGTLEIEGRIPSDGAAQVTGLGVVAQSQLFNGVTWDRDRKPNATSRIVSAAATTNPTVAKASAGDLFRVTGFNANAAARYLKIYNKATAPTVGTDTPVWTEYLPAQARFELSFPKGYYLSAGISYALTTGVADADTGALTAADILGLNLAYA